MASLPEITVAELAFSRDLESNEPAVGYNRWPRCFGTHNSVSDKRGSGRGLANTGVTEATAGTPGRAGSRRPARVSAARTEERRLAAQRFLDICRR